MLASFAGKVGSIKELAALGAKFTLQDKGGSMALHWCMDSNNVELVDYFIELSKLKGNPKNIDLNCKDYNGWTPILRLGEYTFLFEFIYSWLH